MADREVGAARAAEVTSSGVEALIRRLRDDGVAAGRAEGEAIVRAAEGKAETIVDEARARGAEIVDEARQEADRLRAAGEESLRMASRDMVLRLQEELIRKLENRVRRLVSDQLEDREILCRLLLEVVSAALRDSGVAAAERVEILLPAEVIAPEELREATPESEGPLGQLARQIASAAWREGVTLAELGPGRRGIRVRLVDEAIEIDLSEEAITGLLMEHLQPRFRTVMEGVVR